MITKVVKIPVRILDESDEIRAIKYKALDKIFYESRYLANKGVQFLTALRLKDANGERLIPPFLSHFQSILIFIKRPFPDQIYDLD